MKARKGFVPLNMNQRADLEIRKLEAFFMPKISKKLKALWREQASWLSDDVVSMVKNDPSMLDSWQEKVDMMNEEFVTETFIPMWTSVITTSGEGMVKNVQKYVEGKKSFDIGFSGKEPWKYTADGERFFEWIMIRNKELCAKWAIANEAKIRAVIDYYTTVKPSNIETIAKNLRSSVSMSERQVRAAINKRIKLEASGMTEKQIDNAMAIYEKQKVAQRCMNIVRTETATAFNYGQHDVIVEAQNLGYFGGDVYKELYIAGNESACDVCKELVNDMEPIPVGESYHTSKGDYDEPPFHNNCCCSSGYLVKENLVS